jgi:ABC-type lipoprotein release transport system permease subunit
VAVATGLGLTTLLASYLPAARAARVAPAEALRREM